MVGVCVGLAAVIGTLRFLYGWSLKPLIYLSLAPVLLLTLYLHSDPELAKVISAGYRYTRDPNFDITQVNQIDITGQWPLTSRLYAVGRYNWSFLGKQTVGDPSPGGQLLEAIAGFEYNAGCWAARVVAQRLAALSGSPNTTLFLQLELTDFGSVGSNPISLLRRSIPGYGKTNELNTSSSLLTTQ